MIMVPNFSRPFSAFTDGDNNPASFIIGQHYEARDLAIEELFALYKKGVDIEDAEIFYAVLDKHGLTEDGFESEEETIITELRRKIRQWRYSSFR